MEWIIILVLVFVIIINLVVACEMKRIAESKGHSGKKYFHYSFWLGIAGWTIVAALPDLTLRQQLADTPPTAKTPTSPNPASYTSEVTNKPQPTKNAVFGRTELFVKSNTDGFPSIKVTIIHNGQLTEAQLNHLQTLRLDEARKYCADHKVNLITG
jgi:hypothetical protein